jgi:hypothetical protein
VPANFKNSLNNTSLAADPAGVVIMAIVAVLYLFKKAFDLAMVAITGSDSARTQLSAWMKAFGFILDTLKRSVTETFALLYNLFTLDFKAAKENIKNPADINFHMVENAKAAYDATIAEDTLNNAIARNSDITAVNKARIEERARLLGTAPKQLPYRSFCQPVAGHDNAHFS